MGYYLEDHPPASPQSRCPRRETDSGLTVFHSTEGGLASALNVANYISQRPNPGSYHSIVDDEGWVDLISEACEAFHVAAGGINWHSVGLSFATNRSLWGQDTERDTQLLINMAQRTAHRAVSWHNKTGNDPRLVARWVTPDEAFNRTPGMITHGELQGDRTDPWVGTPVENELRERFRLLVRTEIDRLMGTTEVPSHERSKYALLLMED